jgi:omega-6 fatty acid desaturase (delta-12 desaturase)
MKSPDSLHFRTKVYARDHSLKSWWCILSTVFLLVAATAGTFPVWPLPARILCSLLASLLSVRMFVIYHDQQHRAILPKSPTAEFIMRLVGLWALSASSIWRASHDHHHAHNSKLRGSNIGSFPIMTREQYKISSRGERFKYLFMRNPAVILLGYLSVFVVGMTLIPLFTAPRKHYDCLLALLLHVVTLTVIVIYFGWLTVLLAVVIPRFIASAMGSYFFYAQHNFPGVSFKTKDGWTFEKAALESSSHLKTGPIMQWFTANIGYHHIHHLNHRIPFYRLPEIYRDFPELRQAKTTTLHPLDIWRCFRLKVWCVETQRMVGVQGL